MKRISALLAVLLGLSLGAMAQEPPAKKSAAQEMMDQAEKALDQADAATGGGSRPIVVPGEKAKASKAETAKAKEAYSVAPAAAAPAAQPKAEEVSANVPVKIVSGTGTSKTTLAPAPVVFPDADDGQIAQGQGSYVPMGGSAAPRQMVPRAGTPISSTGLPGLGNPQGNSQGPAKPITIQAQNGVNEMVPVSTVYPNRIATPFATPKVVDFSPTQYQVVGSDIYVVPKGDKPIGIFIRDGSRPNDSFTVALTLVPKQIPGVTVLVNIDGAQRVASKPGKGDHEEEAEVASYEDMLRKMMRRLVLEKPMSGYTETNLDAGVAMIGPLRVIPEKQLSGQTFDIYRYRIVNTGKESLELSEESFYQTGVKAVAFYPAVRVDPWKSTKVFIITGKGGEADDER